MCAKFIIKKVKTKFFPDFSAVLTRYNLVVTVVYPLKYCIYVFKELIVKYVMLVEHKVLKRIRMTIRLWVPQNDAAP
jgi:hypothetical protein